MMGLSYTALFVNTPGKSRKGLCLHTLTVKSCFLSFPGWQQQTVIRSKGKQNRCCCCTRRCLEDALVMHSAWFVYNSQPRFHGKTLEKWSMKSCSDLCSNLRFQSLKKTSNNCPHHQQKLLPSYVCLISPGIPPTKFSLAIYGKFHLRMVVFQTRDRAFFSSWLTQGSSFWVKVNGLLDGLSKY